MVEEESKKITTKAIFIAAITIFIVYSVILFMYKYNNDTFSMTKLLIFIGAGILVLGGIPTIFWYLNNRDSKLRDKLRKEFKSLPEPVSVEECRIIRDKEILEHYENYLDVPEFEDTPSVGIGIKSSIYMCLATGKYDDPYASENYPKFFIAINMHFPDKKKAIIKDPTPTQMEKVLARIASFPEGDPDIREIIERNPLLGTERVTKETVHKKDEGKEKPEKEDLVEKEGGKIQ